MNILIPFWLLYLPTLILKKLTSIREFIDEQMYECSLIKAKKEPELSKGKKQLKLHGIETEISKFYNKMERYEIRIFFWGLSFLLITFYLTSCFCGIYENSVSCLTLNTIMSIVFTFIITIIIFFVSTILRRYALRKGKVEMKKEEKYILAKIFNISRFLNPTYHFYKLEEEIKNEKKKKEEEEKEEKEKRKKSNLKDINLV